MRPGDPHRPRGEQVRDLHDDPRRVELQPPAPAGQRRGDALARAAVMHHEPPRGIHDEVMRDAGQAEMAIRLAGRVDPRGRRRPRLRYDHGVGHDMRVVHVGAAMDEGVVLTGRVLRQAREGAADDRLAAEARPPDRVPGRDGRRELRLGMQHPLRRAFDHEAEGELQLDAAVPRGGRIDELVRPHPRRRRDAGHGTSSFGLPRYARRARAQRLRAGMRLGS